MANDLKVGQVVLVRDSMKLFWTAWPHKVVEVSGDQIKTAHVIRYAEDPENLVFTFRREGEAIIHVSGLASKKAVGVRVECELIPYSGPVGKGVKVVIPAKPMEQQAAALASLPVPQVAAEPKAEQAPKGRKSA